MAPKYSTEEIEQMQSETDHDRLDSMTDEEITAAAMTDPDNPPLDDAFFERAKKKGA